MKMHRGSKKGFIQIIDIADYYLCAIYDFLWGARLSRLAARAYREKRSLNWHENMATRIGNFIPMRIMIWPTFVSIRILHKRMRRLEKEWLSRHGC
jgi:hypothetical protein